MADPFDSVTPIGQDRRPASLRLSPREQHVRAHADHSSPPAPATLRSSDPATGTPKEPSKRRRRLKPTLKVEELKAMAERLAQRAYRVAMTPDEVVRVDAAGTKTRVKSGVKEFDRKNATASFGIAVDKLQMLAGRPTQIHEVREERAGLKDLALRLLQGGQGA